ncbi:cobyrinate a,c-diamide synthase [Clostridium sp. AM58-1XD]|uniref:cobyrinate a,c-diamide synthase n=1 Tax=Clostridium sp. AM58-1XD TaxID=2292307 RepID=UPI001FA8F5BF|nr:cobyrinate a,c-diamide synthase [Clostridium sp. AM58-1XD]
MYGRIMVAAPKSGSGKTLLTCGLLTVMKNRNLSVRAYKCGPDYIDPMFHRQVLGVPGGNLDSYFSGEEAIRKRIRNEMKNTDIAVMEGVMGYYDGLGGNSTRASSYDIARITKTPVILVIDGKGMSLSMGAVIKGFREYRKDSRIAAVIANRTNPMMESRLRSCVEEQGVAFLGCLPALDDWRWESRHLGLMLPDEIGNVRETVERLAEGMERYLDIGRLLSIASEAESLSSGESQTDGVNLKDDVDLAGDENRSSSPAENKTVKIAVAMDEAFCFYYQENLAMLEELGAELLYFSPMRDGKLPEETDGLLLGGGYPESCARELAENSAMNEAVREAAKNGMPISAECGGFLYLQEELEGEDGRFYPMAGVLKGKGFRTGKLNRFGYIELTAGKNGGFMKAGDTIRGHEFHYWDSTENGSSFHAEKPAGKKGWDCIRTELNITAGFPHLYYPSGPSYAKGFVRSCVEYGKYRRYKGCRTEKK